MEFAGKALVQKNIKCNQCSEQTNGRCSDVSRKLQNVAYFRCKRCADGQLFHVTMNEILISSLDSWNA